MQPCPTCGGPAPLDASNPHRPFCCARCRDVDLGRWLNEDYVIPGQHVEVDDQAPSRSIDLEERD